MADYAYYAVRKGRKVGIFKSWNECRIQVDGFSNSEYRGFTDIDEAIAYMELPVIEDSEPMTAEEIRQAQLAKAEHIAAASANAMIAFAKAGTKKQPAREPEGYSEPTTLSDNLAFVDGSYNQKTKTYGYGGFVTKDGRSYFFSGSGSDAEMASMRNVAGEISGAMAAVRKAEELGLTFLTICYDYTGIENWAMGNWKTNKKGTSDYAAFMKEAMQRIEIRFQKVKAHTGIPGNEKADSLAKEAAGVT